jgi:small subunit ribosomal protein S17
MDKDNPTPKKKIQRIFSGTVVSDKMDKTILVKINRTRIHTKYKKRYTVSRQYKVDDSKNQFKTGDVVKFIECRPLSKDKRWRVIYS